MENPITVLANVARGYATDSQCENALKRDVELTEALSNAYEAMLVMRAMLAKADVSLKGGKLQQVIDSVAMTLHPVKGQV